MHGDVKPRNIIRVGAHFKLIDFDAAVALDKPHSGKLSTAYAAAIPGMHSKFVQRRSSD